ncbi:BlaI/MecI/CopY family transcriptional regulator [Aquimarina agarivorans]|uniref:BlaI/MecI/CopY family transcriptional regulator n=1 Tax=Aquimarina agarivorans TaxID=980584 RepID=UPI000248F5D7|nr:BlaI/MecI/CopY family transcriptional regulator [Aquimarina agarivorans]
MKKQLTKAEEDVMLLLWQLNKASVAELIAEMTAPKPAYNTVSTIIRILETKGFVDHEKKGKGYIYYPIINKKDYSKQSINKLMEGYFGGSFKSMVSFFVKENNVSVAELDEILKEINSEKE